MVRPLLFVGKRVSDTAPARKKQKTNTKAHKNACGRIVFRKIEVFGCM
jgi:hypothetical protein